MNVGCHTDAHEQAKWFGDDIALKSGKYDFEPTSVRAKTSGLRRLGAGRPPLHRLRVGVAFATSGYKELNDMFAHHAEMAAGLAQEALQLPGGVHDALLAAYESWTAAAGRTGSRARRSRWRRASCSPQSTPRSRTVYAASRARARSRESAPAGSSIRR